MPYTPNPIDTSNVLLPASLNELTEHLAQNTHEVWARQRTAQGWTFGPQRDDAKKQHPDLIPYDELPDGEKEFDRLTAMETLKVIVALGYVLSKP
jgi:ryanodine receptor 2